MTVVLVTCSYKAQEFIRVGYYVNNAYGEALPEGEAWPRPPMCQSWRPGGPEIRSPLLVALPTLPLCPRGAERRSSSGLFGLGTSLCRCA